MSIFFLIMILMLYIMIVFKVTSLSLKTKDGLIKINSDFYFFSCPFTEIVSKLKPKPPERILNCCSRLRYRHHIGVKA